MVHLLLQRGFEDIGEDEHSRDEGWGLPSGTCCAIVCAASREVAYPINAQPTTNSMGLTSFSSMRYIFLPLSAFMESFSVTVTCNVDFRTSYILFSSYVYNYFACQYGLTHLIHVTCAISSIGERALSSWESKRAHSVQLILRDFVIPDHIDVCLAA